MSKPIDETGHVYGKLVVIKRGPNDKNNRAQWFCKCSCGNEILTLGTYLRNKSVTSCGCGKFSPKVKDETGKIYGDWKVIRRDKNRIGEAYWLCECLKCGTISSVLGTNLKTGKSQSCGCLKSKGEQLISSILTELKYNFKKEVHFLDLKSPLSNNPLRFDFGVFNDEDNLLFLIEYQGIQHEKDIPYFGNSLHDNLLRDAAKREYCKQKGIPLICFTHINGKIPNYEDTKASIKESYEEIINEISN